MNFPRNLRSILLDPDVNDGGGSSAASTDVTGGTSSNPQTATEVEETSTSDVNKPGPTLASVTDKIIADALAKNAAKSESSTEKKEESEESGSTEDQDPKEEKAEEKVDAEAPQEEGEEKKIEADDEKGPIPYERFKEVNDKVSEYEAKVKEYEPLAQAHQSIVNFCQENNISNEDFQQMLEIGRLIQVDPAAARKAIEPIWSALNGLTGETLPADLAQEVEDGTLTQARAKEIAKLRGTHQFSNLQSQNTQKRLQQDQQRQFVNSVQSAVKTWSDTKVLADPDFKPKPGPNAPDGKYEVYVDKFSVLLANNPPKTVADAIKHAEAAYSAVNKMFTSLRPAKQVSKNLSSTKSTSSKSSTGDKTPFVVGGAVPSSVISNVLRKYQK